MMRPESDPWGATAGLIGLGLMGSALAERLLGAGYAVVGYDVVAEKRTALECRGGQAAPSARAVAERARCFLFSLMTTDQVEGSLAEMGSAPRPGALVIDTTTGRPEQMAALGARLAASRIDYLDATIAGNSEETRAGTVLVLAGGEASAFAFEPRGR